MNPISVMWRRGGSDRGASALVALMLLTGCGAFAAPDLFAAETKPSRSSKPKPPAPPAPSGAQDVPDVPDAPDHDVPLPPRPPKKAGGDKSSPRYVLEEGSTNVGDLYLMKDAVIIRGKQEGDLSVWCRELDVTGTVTGDINAMAQSVELSGMMGDSVRAMGQSVHVSGTIDGDLVAVGESIQVEKGARITGDLDAKGARVQMDGTVDGEFSATGGEVHLSGKVGSDAELKGDIIEVDPSARVGGDLSYTSRNRIDLDDDEDVVGGTVSYTPGESKPKVSSGGFIKWFFWTCTALLASLVSLAMFRRSAPEVVAAVRTDGLRSAGIGFISAIVIPVALLISCILIITIPAVALGYIAYFMLLYLSQVPVAVFVGEWLMARMGKNVGPFAAAAVGVPVMYVVFSIPVLGKLALFTVLFTGFGAIVITIWTARQARRAGGNLPPPAPATGAAPAPA